MAAEIGRVTHSTATSVRTENNNKNQSSSIQENEGRKYLEQEQLDIRYAEVDVKNITQLRVLNTATLPVRYQDKFYRDVLEKEDKLTQLAYYDDVLVGALCGRVEPIQGTSDSQLYIMTMSVLSPYRGMRVGARLLERVMKLAKEDARFNVRSVYLHVQVRTYKAQSLSLSLFLTDLFCISVTIYTYRYVYVCVCVCLRHLLRVISLYSLSLMSMSSFVEERERGRTMDDCIVIIDVCDCTCTSSVLSVCIRLETLTRLSSTYGMASQSWVKLRIITRESNRETASCCDDH